MNEKKEIKKRILRKAKSMFEEAGYNGVTTDGLASSLGISKRTLYSYFPTKKSIYEEIVDTDLENTLKIIEGLVSEIENEENGDFIGSLKNLLEYDTKKVASCKDFYKDADKYNPKIWKKVKKFRNKHMKSIFSRIFNAGQKKGFIRNNVNFEILYLIHYYSVQNILTPETIWSLPVTMKEAIDSLYDIFFRGILSEKAVNEYVDKFEAA